MRYICIHGHFYQPPRENPWLEHLSTQDSAGPYHDWNDRITAECYAPNGAARILDQSNQIVDIVNNYRNISFNFGPTLLSWFRDVGHRVHHSIVDADKESVAHWGHGSAMAQVYNHLIMPLANTRDKRTQIAWGVADFEHRFGRKPEGMWLAETAVDSESLDLMAEQGIKFTILAPRQARTVRQIGAEGWTDLGTTGINPRRPYLVNLPSGRSISIFFYDGPVSQAVAFERLLSSGEKFAQRLLNAFDDHHDEDQLVHIATDGESYGHHHRFGEMGLAYALRWVEQRGAAKVTTYASYLAAHPPTWEAQIFEDTAWSCAHGLGRWKEDCGCRTRTDWHQRWRKPLRESLDWLRDSINARFDKEAALIFTDPWAARDAYISVILERTPAARDAFLTSQCHDSPVGHNRERAFKLMELQRNMQLMYTSCGWFFDDISGLEGTQVLSYAARVIQLAEELLTIPLEPEFIARISTAESNLPALRNGGFVYINHVLPNRLTLKDVAAHFAISSIFRNLQTRDSVYCYDVESLAGTAWRGKHLSLVAGRIKVTSRITEECGVFTYSAFHEGDHNLECAVTAEMAESGYAEFHARLEEAFGAGDDVAIMRLHREYCEGPSYGLRNVFPDDQRHILKHVMSETVAKMEAAYREMKQSYAPVLELFADLDAPLPRVLQLVEGFVLHREIRDLLQANTVDVARVKALFEEAERNGVELDMHTLEYFVRQVLKSDARLLPSAPEDLTVLHRLRMNCGLLEISGLPISLWTVQNNCFKVLRQNLSEMRRRDATGSAHAHEWLSEFRIIARYLNIRWEE